MGQRNCGKRRSIGRQDPISKVKDGSRDVGKWKRSELRADGIPKLSAKRRKVGEERIGRDDGGGNNGVNCKEEGES